MENFEKFLLNKPAWVTGLIQTLGVIIYVVIFVSTAFLLQPHVHINSPIIGATTFLTAFVTSALICGSLVLGLPTLLTLKGHLKHAVLLLVWSAIWFVVILLSWVILLAALG